MYLTQLFGQGGKSTFSLIVLSNVKRFHLTGVYGTCRCSGSSLIPSLEVQINLEAKQINLAI